MNSRLLHDGNAQIDDHPRNQKVSVVRFVVPCLGSTAVWEVNHVFCR